MEVKEEGGGGDMKKNGDSRDGNSDFRSWVEIRFFLILARFETLLLLSKKENFCCTVIFSIQYPCFVYI